MSSSSSRPIEEVDSVRLEEEGKSVLPIPAPPARGRSMLKSIGLIATCAGAMVVNTASNTSTAIALPSVGKDLRIEEDKLQWLVSAFALSSGCFLLFFGRLADLYGRKKAFMLGSLVQTCFALGCGFAKTPILIDVLRALQGCGAAATIPACIGILAHAFPPSRMRAVAFSTFAAGAPLGAAIGNTFGAVLTQLTDPSWRSVFYFSSGISFLCLIGGTLTIDADQPSSEKDKRVDYFGAFLVTAGLTLIIFVLSDASNAPKEWATPYIIALLIVGVLLVAAFLAWQWYLEKKIGEDTRFPPPIMKLSMWTRSNGRFAVMQFIAFLSWCSFLSYNFWVQLFYQDYLHLNPILTMIRLLPMFVTGVCCNILIALFVGRIDIVYIMVIGTACTACANIFFAVVRPSQPYWAYGFPASILSVFGADFVFSAGTLFIAKISLPHEQSVAGAMFQTMTQLGTAFGLSITTIIFNRVRDGQAHRLGFEAVKPGEVVPQEAELLAYRAAEWGAFAFGIIATLLAAIFLRGVGVIGARHGKPKIDAEADKTIELEPMEGHAKETPSH